MIEVIEPGDLPSLDDYAKLAHLSHTVLDLKQEAARLAPSLRGRRVWMLNSTATGGGVAEMLPRLVTLLSELGVDTRWLVMGTERLEFFPLTKHLHNLIHGRGDPTLGTADRELYETVSREVMRDLEHHVDPQDIVVCHDPQPLGAVALLKKNLGMPAVWRCHIGLDDDCPQTEAAWSFLEPYVKAYDHWIFTAPEYIPNYLSSRVSIICPALDPFSGKNKHLSTHEQVAILENSGLLPGYQPVVTPAFEHPVLRLRGDGKFVVARDLEDLGLLFRPIVTQISRWDALKGWRPLLDAFVQMKRHIAEHPEKDALKQRSLELARLVLGGPEPAAVADDPEAVGVLDELIGVYRSLSPDLQKDIALLSLPMTSREQNAMIVNALQRCSTVVVQNSLREGFGLTVTEAMWKGTAVLGSMACGIRQQIRHQVDGHLNPQPEAVSELAEAMRQLLVDPALRKRYGNRAQRHVHDDFLVFDQTKRYLRVLTDVLNPPRHTYTSKLPPPR